MAGRRATGWGVTLVAALALGACDDPAPRQGQGQGQGQAPAGQDAAGLPQGRPAAALAAAEERLRARLRMEGPMSLRAVQAYRQALSDTLAICGQVNPSGRGDDAWLPWVAVVSFDGQTASRTEFFIAASTPEATRVYFEMVDRCFDGGGPASPRQGIRPLPPAPSDLPRAADDSTPRAAVQPAGPAAAPALPVATPSGPGAAPNPAPNPAPMPMPAAGPAQGAAQGSVTTSARTPVNVRSGPSGANEVVRVVPRASALQVFGEAPGGWVQVGEGGEAWGWLHNSMLER
jgi:hypothetical protein